MRHKITKTWQGETGVAISYAAEPTFDNELNLNVVVPASTTDQVLTQALTAAKIKSIFFVSDRDVTLEQNSATVPVLTITLKAGVPYDWNSKEGRACPITTNITAWYQTNAGSSSATIKYRIGYDN